MSVFKRPDSQFSDVGFALSPHWDHSKYPTSAECWAVCPLFPPRQWFKERGKGNPTRTKRGLIKAWQATNAGSRAQQQGVAAAYMDAAYKVCLDYLSADDTLDSGARILFARVLSGHRVRRSLYTEEVLQEVCNLIGSSSTYQELMFTYGNKIIQLPVEPDGMAF